MQAVYPTLTLKGLLPPDLALTHFKEASVTLREVLRQQRRAHPRMCWEVCRQIATVLKDVHDKGHSMGTLDSDTVRLVYSDGDIGTSVWVTV